ncbi:putative aluminum-activated malate transporter [Helianthus anomalus]
MTNIFGSLSRDKSRERLLFRKGHPELGYYSESGSTIENDDASIPNGIKKWWINVWWHLVNAYNMGRSDPRKFKFGVKSGLAFAIVSLLTYVTEPVQLISENIIWAILTVILIFEWNVGK